MHLDELREHCLSFEEVTEGFPFGPEVLVFKAGGTGGVGGKMFALAGMEGETVNLKCDPERAIELREQYPHGVLPGYHMNKKTWNTVVLRGEVPDALILELIAHSYALITAKPKPKPGKTKKS
jgi:predicted DNA-binding protein (MmcQ/YjbR family)